MEALAEKYQIIERKEEITQKESEQKIMMLEEALKGKSKYLIDHLQRDRGRV